MQYVLRLIWDVVDYCIPFVMFANKSNTIDDVSACSEIEE